MIGTINNVVKVDPDASKAERLGIKFLSGSFGSAVGTLANTPFDVVKSRLQGQQGQGKYKNAFQAVGLVLKEEGAGALYKGLMPRLLRLGPGGGIMIVAFDFISGLLKDF